MVVTRQGGPVSLPFLAPTAGEAVATLSVSAPGVDWSVRGAESAVLSVAVDGRYATDLVVTSASPIGRRVALGTVSVGRHSLTFTIAADRSATTATQIRLDGVRTEVVPPGDARHTVLAHAPVLFGRSIAVASTEGNLSAYKGPLQNAVTDTPLVAWHEKSAGTIPGDTMLEYSVVWTNEDGGTNTPALMARWGRTTDIEWIYRVEVDASGRTVPGSEVYQGGDHDTVPFRGIKEGDHPLLQTCTANNMVCDSLDGAVMRFGLVPDRTRLSNRARESLMEAEPWTWSVMTAEMQREGRIEPRSNPATAELGDPRSYLYLEVDKDTLLPGTPPVGPWVGLSVVVKLTDGRTFRSDHGKADWSIKRDVPAGTSVELPLGTTADQIKSISGDRMVVNGDTTAGVSVTDINRAFFLDAGHRPLASFVSWHGAVTLTAAAPTAVLWSR